MIEKPARWRKMLNVLSDLAEKGNYAELKRRAEDRKGWQKLESAESHNIYFSVETGWWLWCVTINSQQCINFSGSGRLLWRFTDVSWKSLSRKDVSWNAVASPGFGARRDTCRIYWVFTGGNCLHIVAVRLCIGQSALKEINCCKSRGHVPHCHIAGDANAGTALSQIDVFFDHDNGCVRWRCWSTAGGHATTTSASSTAMATSSWSRDRLCSLRRSGLSWWRRRDISW